MTAADDAAQQRWAEHLGDFTITWQAVRIIPLALVIGAMAAEGVSTFFVVADESLEPEGFITVEHLLAGRQRQLVEERQGATTKIQAARGMFFVNMSQGSR